MLKAQISVVKATALEILSEPLTLLLLLAALTLTVLAPAFHYHQFGEATRMARDAGFSAMFTCGCAVAVFCTIRAFRREIESGTLQMALSHPLSRTSFFISKTFGALTAYLVFAAIVFFTSLTIIEGARIGGAIASRTGDIARLHGPFLAAGTGVMFLPLVIGAALNRFAQCRFVLSSNICALALSAAAALTSSFFDPTLIQRHLPVAALLAISASVLLTAAAAFSVSMPANAAAAASGVFFAISIPCVGNYYMSNALSGGGSVPWSYVALATAAAAPALIAFIVLGIRFIGKRDIS